MAEPAFVIENLAAAIRPALCRLLELINCQRTLIGVSHRRLPGRGRQFWRGSLLLGRRRCRFSLHGRASPHPDTASEHGRDRRRATQSPADTRNHSVPSPLPPVCPPFFPSP